MPDRLRVRPEFALVLGLGVVASAVALYWGRRVVLDGVLVPIHVQNRTAAALTFTPAVPLGPSRRLQALPLYDGYKATPRRTRIAIRPGETVTIVYNIDDVYFSEIIVDRDGTPVGEVVSPNPREFWGRSAEFPAVISDATLRAPSAENLSMLREVIGAGGRPN